MSNEEEATPGGAVLAGYALDAASLFERYESIASADHLRHVADLLPAAGALVVDIGAGTGRDAAWLAAQGHHVLAVEPTAVFRDAGQRRHASKSIEWMDDALPSLPMLRATGRRFDLVLLSAVWAHLQQGVRGEALANLAALLKPAGTLIMSLRHGPSAPQRPTYPVSAEEATELADALGLELIRCVAADSVQPGNRAAGVTWSWLAFRSSPMRD